MPNDNIIDVDFIENGKEEQKMFTIKQVSELLNETTKTINYWVVKLDDILVVQMVGRERIFTENDVENLRHIQHMVNIEKMDTDQIKLELNKPHTSLIIKQDKPKINKAMIETIANVLSYQIIDKIQQLNKENMNEITTITRELCTTIEENTKDELNKQNEVIETQSKYIKQLEKKMTTLNKGINEQVKISKSIDEKLSQQEEKSIERDIVLTETLKNNMENRKKNQEQDELTKSNKGFFTRLFNK